MYDSVRHKGEFNAHELDFEAVVNVMKVRQGFIISTDSLMN